MCFICRPTTHSDTVLQNTKMKWIPTMHTITHIFPFILTFVPSAGHHTCYGKWCLPAYNRLLTPRLMAPAITVYRQHCRSVYYLQAYETIFFSSTLSSICHPLGTMDSLHHPTISSHRFIGRTLFVAIRSGYSFTLAAPLAALSVTPSRCGHIFCLQAMGQKLRRWQQPYHH